MKIYIVLTMMGLCLYSAPLGLPDLVIPKDNPQTKAKISLGDELYHDPRFSADGKVSCSTCHAREKAFSDNLSVSKGFKNRTGTRNAPTVINAAYFSSQFWDGRSPSLEDQAKQPPINPVEGGLHSHKEMENIVKNDSHYQKAFRNVFGIKVKDISIEHIVKAISSFERTIIAGDSAFDRYAYLGEEDALSTAQKRGLDVFLNQGRCVSCHTMNQSYALFTDDRFHNIGVGVKKLGGKEGSVAALFLKSIRSGKKLDEEVLSNSEASELGRFAVTKDITDMGAFKTSTLRNIEKTSPYMHDGSISTLESVVTFYNEGGRLSQKDPESKFLDGGIKPLNLSKEQQADLVAFLKALTSPEYK